MIGDGHNFVRTMASLAEKGVSPSVVDDQVGRLTFAGELSRATRHLVDVGAAYGTYNLSQRRAGHLVGRPREGGLRAVAVATPATSRR